MFQLKSKESVSDGIKRNVTRELTKVLKHVDAKSKPGRKDTSQAEAAHEIRKCFKKARAALRLVREVLGDDVYREENWCFRDAARPLTEVRDAEMLIETFEKLRSQFADQLENALGAKVHETMRANQNTLIRRIINEERAFLGVKEVAQRALARVSEWGIDRDGWDALEAGTRRVYRAGHRALSLADESPSVANLHEWRKQVKYLWHVLQLLEPAWTVSQKGLGDQFHDLSRLLGEDHDLAVLRQSLAADPLSYGGHQFLKGLFVLIDRQRKMLEQQAFRLGQQLYKDSSKIFTARLESNWRAWAAGTSGAKPEPRPSTKFDAPQRRPIISAPAKQRRNP